MTIEKYSPAALERRRKQAREYYKRKRDTNDEFRISENKRKREYYAARPEQNRERFQYYYNGTIEEHIAKLIRKLKSREINIHEFNRRYHRALIRLDAGFRKKPNKRKHRIKHRTGVHVCGSDSQNVKTKT